MDLKSGVKTTEFYMTLIAQVVSLLAILGVIPNSQVDYLTKAVISVFAGLISLVSLISYIKGRIELKAQKMELEPKK